MKLITYTKTFNPVFNSAKIFLSSYKLLVSGCRGNMLPEKNDCNCSVLHTLVRECLYIVSLMKRKVICGLKKYFNPIFMLKNGCSAVLCIWKLCIQNKGSLFWNYKYPIIFYRGAWKSDIWKFQGNHPLDGHSCA